MSDLTFNYKVGCPVQPETTGLSDASLDAPLPGFQIGDRVYFGGDHFMTTPILTNSIRGLLTALRDMGVSTVLPLGRDEQNDEDVLLTLDTYNRATYRKASRKWRNGTLTYKDLLLTSNSVTGPLYRQEYNGCWNVDYDSHTRVPIADDDNYDEVWYFDDPIDEDENEDEEAGVLSS